MDSRSFSRSNSIMLVASLAAVYAILRIIPTFPLVGVPGAYFSVADVIASLYGILLGPYLGPLSIMLGTFIGYFAGRPPVFLGLDFMPAAINSMVVGFIMRGKRKYSIIIYLVLLALFFFHPYAPRMIQVGLNFGEDSFTFPFVWMHVIGLIILVSPVGTHISRLINEKSIKMSAIGFLLLSLIGTLSQHLMGNLLFSSIILPTLSAEAANTIWWGIFWVYPIERVIIVILSLIIGLPIIRTLGTSLVNITK
ncbi:MAG: hypothetical protein NWE90_03830 [Candidatus Bathyarchaeota archaeon]|nr:hypothetical protein [Candidatus Bathyarchaeota archaeon]